MNPICCFSVRHNIHVRFGDNRGRAQAVVAQGISRAVTAADTARIALHCYWTGKHISQQLYFYILASSM